MWHMDKAYLFMQNKLLKRIEQECTQIKGSLWCRPVIKSVWQWTMRSWLYMTRYTLVVAINCYIWGKAAACFPVFIFFKSCTLIFQINVICKELKTKLQLSSIKAIELAFWLCRSPDNHIWKWIQWTDFFFKWTFFFFFNEHFEKYCFLNSVFNHFRIYHLISSSQLCSSLGHI